ncbi:hypothetical protein BGP_0731 [Beggiatoa sp. PS]|nr:hypothetical protein BGP_0731 [Beggiatoa sp. PS]
MLYAITTTYKISIELEYTQKREETLKSNIKAIKGALYLVMSKTEGITDEQIKEIFLPSSEKQESRSIPDKESPKEPPQSLIDTYNKMANYYWEGRVPSKTDAAIGK